MGDPIISTSPTIYTFTSHTSYHNINNPRDEVQTSLIILTYRNTHYMRFDLGDGALALADTGLYLQHNTDTRN